MWAQTWENAFKIVSPFPNVTNPLDEVNEALVKQVNNWHYLSAKILGITLCAATVDVF